MRPASSLRYEILLALAVLLIAALGLAAAAFLLWLPLGGSSARILAFLGILIALDVALFVFFGDYLLRRTVLEPMSTMVEGAEAIAAGDYSRRIPIQGAHELERVADSVNKMAERLIHNQEKLTENIRSLNEVNRALTVARDELVRAEKLASVGQLAAGIAHEIGNPLGAIIGYLEVAERRRGVDPELLEELRREARRIDKIVKGLLDYARPRQPSSRRTQVNDVVREAVDLLETQGRFKETEVVLRLAEDLPAVQADSHQLEQVMVNLLLNAAEAIDGGSDGRVTIATISTIHRVDAPPARRRDDPSGVDYSHLRRLQARWSGVMPPPVPHGTRVVEVAVTDNGPGIPRDILERVFDPFFSTKAPGQGTGLGLAVSARLVEGMGGTIKAERREGDGTCFSVLLPAAENWDG